MEWIVILIILLLIVGGWGGVHVGMGMTGLIDLLFLVLVIAVIVWLVRAILGTRP